MDMVQDCHGPVYEWHQLFCEPGDCGHSACSRSRTYAIGAHQERTTKLHCPWEIQEVMKHSVRGSFTFPSDYLTATTMEVELEAQEKARTRKIPYIPGKCDYSYLLTTRESAALNEYKNAYYKRTHCDAAKNEDLFMFLGDDPKYSLTWSFHGRLPTYRMNFRSGLLWNARYSRWLTSKERLLTLGWPVISEVAEEMQCPPIPAIDVKRAGDIAGNSMHVFNTGSMQMIALSAFGPAGTTAAGMDTFF